MATDHTLFAPAFAGDVSIDGLWTGVDDGGGVLSWHKTFGGTNSDLAWSAATKTVTNSNGTDATLTDADGANSGLMSVALYDELAAATADIITNAAAIAVTKDSPFVIPSLDDSNSITISHDNADAKFSTDDGAFQFSTSEVATTRIELKPSSTTPAVSATELRMFSDDELDWFKIVVVNSEVRIDMDGAAPGAMQLQYSSNSNVALFGGAVEGETSELVIRGFRSGDAARTLQVGVGIDAADTASFDGVSNYLFDGIVAADDITLPSGLLEATLASLASDIAAIESGTALATTTEDLLLDVPAADGEIRTVTNFYADHSGPDYSLTFRWSSTSTDSNDDCLCVKPTAIGGGAGRWIAQFSGAINAAWTGVKGDNAADDTAALQKAVNLAINGDDIWDIEWNTREVFIPRGSYKTTDTIHLGWGETFQHLTVRGDGELTPYVANGGTIIYPTFTDRPVFVIQGARHYVFQSIDVIGADNTASTFTHPEADPTVWDALSPYYEDDINNPYCGIAIDPYSGDKPALTPYPEPTIPAELGITSWNRNHSSKVIVRGCRFWYFASGIAIKPSHGAGFDNNADFISAEDCLFVYCKHGITSDGSQNRQTTMVGGGANSGFSAMSGGVYGTLNVTQELKVTDGATFSAMAYIAWCESANWMSRCTIENSMAEILGSICHITNGSTVTPVVNIDGNDFRFTNGDDTNQAMYHVNAVQCMLNITNNRFAIYHSATSSRPMFAFNATTKSTRIEGNSLFYPLAAVNANQTAGQELGWATASRPLSDVTGSSNTPSLYRFHQLHTVQQLQVSLAITHSGAGSWTGTMVGQHVGKVAIGDFISCNPSGNNLQTYFFKVTNIVGSVITMLQLNDTDVNGDPLDAATVKATIESGGTYLAVSHRAEVGDAATQETVTQYPSLTTTPFEINYALGATAIVTLNEALEAISDVTNLPVGASLTLFCTKTSQADSLTLDATNFTTQSATFAADSAAVPVGEMMSVKFTRIKAGSGGGEIYAEQSFAKVDAVSPGHLGVPTIGRINNYWLDETPGALPSGTEGASITIRIMSENVGASPAAKALATGAATHYSYQVTDTGVITPLATDNS